MENKKIGESLDDIYYSAQCSYNYMCADNDAYSHEQSFLWGFERGYDYGQRELFSYIREYIDNHIHEYFDDWEPEMAIRRLPDDLYKQIQVGLHGNEWLYN